MRACASPMRVLYWRAAAVMIALRPLACVFTAVELVLLVLVTLLYERWRWMTDNAASHGELQGLECRDQTMREAAPKIQPMDTKTKMVTSKPIRSDLIGGMLAPTAGMELKCLSSRGASKVRDESCCSAVTDDESMDSCSTSDTSDMLLLSTPLEHRGKCDQMSDLGFSDIHFSSMAMSRCSSEAVHNVEFMHKSGELQIRGDSVLNVFKPWRKCSILLSVMTGELFVHRKAKTPPQVFPLSRFTGALIHSKRRHSFKVMFDGHPPLYFRATKPHDAELWVKALEYAKETTWRLWS